MRCIERDHISDIYNRPKLFQSGYHQVKTKVFILCLLTLGCMHTHSPQSQSLTLGLGKGPKRRLELVNCGGKFRSCN